MNPFNRLPGSRRAPPGLEWQILKRVPATLMAASFGCAGFVMLLRTGWFALAPEAAQRAEFSTIGLLLSFWILTLTLALGCFIIVVMKGPAYVMDAYPLPDERDQSGDRDYS